MRGVSMSILTKSKDINWAFKDGLVTIRDNENEIFFELNDVGSLIWDMIDGVSTLEDIVQAILKEFDIDKQTAIRETDRFLNELTDFALIEEVKT